MDIFADIINKRFTGSLRGDDANIVLTQNNNQPVRLYLLQPSRYPGSRYPFNYDPASGDSTHTAILSLRNVIAFPVTLASTQPLVAIRDGFSGTFHLNTQEIADFLAGRAERDVAFCVDLIDGSGNKISPFRRSITLQATDSGTTTMIPGAGVIYEPAITGLIGGGLTNLDGQNTASRANGTIWIVIRLVGGELVKSEWIKQPGVAESSEDAGIVKPLDFNAVTNAVNLLRVAGL